LFHLMSFDPVADGATLCLSGEVVPSYPICSGGVTCCAVLFPLYNELNRWTISELDFGDRLEMILK